MTLTDLLPILYALMILVAVYAFYHFFKGDKSSEKEQLNPPTANIQRSKVDGLDWINQWKKVSNLDFSMESEHFFVERRHLDDFSKKLISNARSTLLVANPYVQKCNLSDTLLEAVKKGISVKVITRPAECYNLDYLKVNQAYHSLLEQEGISVSFDNSVHAKIIVVDNKVAVVSSMNFFSGSSAGVSWEAGLVSTSSEVVQNISNFLTEMISNVQVNNRA